MKSDGEITGKALEKLQDSVDKIIEPSAMTTTSLSRIEANTASCTQGVEDALIRRLDALEMQLISRMNRAQIGIDGIRNSHSLVGMNGILGGTG